MILLLPGYTIFLLLTAPRGWRSMFAPRIVALAAVCAAAGALQYAWNLRTLWLLPDPPHGVGRRPAAILVRRHEVRLARHDGDERAAVAASAITSRCTGST